MWFDLVLDALIEDGWIIDFVLLYIIKKEIIFKAYQIHISISHTYVMNKTIWPACDSCGLKYYKSKFTLSMGMKTPKI